MTKYSECEILSGGARIVLSVWEISKPEAVIVFIPATMVHPLIYERLLCGFAERGFCVVGVHPVGHGKSPRDVKLYTLCDIAQNGRDAVSFALDKFNLPVIALGSSQGGIVAAALACADKRIAAVFAHNILLSELPDSIGITRFPKQLRHVYRLAQAAFKFFARLMPKLKLPLGFYLDRKRISRDLKLWESLESDPLCLTHYCLHFLASLFTTRFQGLTDASICCPVYVIADSGDMLFTADYTQKVFERLRAPYKEMVTFNFNDHMLMYSHPQAVCDLLAVKMREALLIA
ncbi:MAG: alpha/beta hydrolase [Endomicrobium sp.]|jgi:alpha-beta hydrolase superfamily lysophospholipase|nr:alpha/beta hydrolase [Endomicrobium sp.]